MLRKMSLLFPILFLVLTINDLECEGIRPTFRLPTTIDPLLYSIKLHPNIDYGSYTGEVLVRVKVKNTVESVLLHSKELSIKSVHLNQQKVPYILHLEYELLEIFRYNRSIPAGIHFIHIEFEGSLLDKESGLYRSTFTEDDGDVRYVVVSDFLPNGARKAFPCFDEPAFKAKFQVTLIAPDKTYVALSSTDELVSYETSDGIVHQFETTGLMSPFALGFFLGQYTSVKVDQQGGPTSIRMYSVDASDEKAVTLTFVPKILAFYSEYTQYDLGHALPKIDFIEFDRSPYVAVDQGWGFVTTAKGMLSTNLEVYNASRKAETRAAVLVYTLVQFWFGNLVTNNWWSDAWLHNGFIVFMGEKAQNKIFFNNSVVDSPKLMRSLKQIEVFQEDQRDDAKAVVTYLEHPRDLRNTLMTSFKAAAVLAMLESALGEKGFQEIVQDYIQTFAFATATTHDFISLVESSHPSKHNYRDFLESFLYQNNFPVIEVAEIDDGYLLKQISSVTNKVQSKWTIPITFNTDLDRNRSVVWFDKNLDKLFVPKGEEKWIRFNYNNDGYYKIIYSASIWDKFYKNCKEMEYSDLELLLFETIALYDLDIISCKDVLIHLIGIGTKCKTVLNGIDVYRFLSEIQRNESDIFDKINAYAASQWKKEPSEWNNMDFSEYMKNSTGQSMSVRTSTDEELAKMQPCIDWAKANFSSSNDDSSGY